MHLEERCDTPGEPVHSGSKRPFTVVIPVFNGSDVLPRLLRSLDAQDFGPERVEVVIVDDGSTDSTLSIVRQWAAGCRFHVRWRSQPNAGVAAARNVGMDMAHGEWLAFVDADDELDEHYLSAVDRFLAPGDSCNVIAVFTNLIRYDDRRCEFRDDHALAYRFRHGPRRVRVATMGWDFQNSASAAVFNRHLVARSGIRFDPGVRPSFEDGHFVARVLLSHPESLLGILPEAKYIYHQGSELPSRAQSSWLMPEKYDSLLVRGAGDLLQRAAAQQGSVPVWLQRQLLYHLQAYFRVAGRSPSPVDELEEGGKQRFLSRLAHVLGGIQPEEVWQFGQQLPYETESLLMLSCHPDRPVVYGAIRSRWVDLPEPVWEVRYLYSRQRPREHLLPSGGVEVVQASSHSLVRYGRRLLVERRLTLCCPDWLDDPGLDLISTGFCGSTDVRPAPLTRPRLGGT